MTRLCADHDEWWPLFVTVRLWRSQPSVTRTITENSVTCRGIFATCHGIFVMFHRNPWYHFLRCWAWWLNGWSEAEANSCQCCLLVAACCCCCLWFWSFGTRLNSTLKFSIVLILNSSSYCFVDIYYTILSDQNRFSGREILLSYLYVIFMLAGCDTFLRWLSYFSVISSVRYFLALGAIFRHLWLP